MVGCNPENSFGNYYYSRAHKSLPPTQLACNRCSESLIHRNLSDKHHYVGNPKTTVTILLYTGCMPNALLI